MGDWQSNYGNSIKNDPLEAKTFDYIILHYGDLGNGGPYQSRFAAIKASNPNVKFLMYTVLNEFSSGDPTPWTSAVSHTEAYYLHNPYTSVDSGHRVVDNGTSRMVADVTQAGYRDAVVQALKSTIQQYGLDGMYVDHAQILGGTVPSGIKQDQWAAGIYALCDAIKAAMPNALLITGSSYPDSVPDGPLVPHVDGTLSEAMFLHWNWPVTDPTNGGFIEQHYGLWQATIKRNLSQQKYLEVNGFMQPALVRGGDPTWEQHWLTWLFANYLIYADGKYLIFGWNNGEYDEAASECQYVNMNVGQPTGAYTTTRNGLLVRRFSGGSITGVIVNATGNMVTNDAGFGPGSLGPFTGFIQ